VSTVPQISNMTLIPFHETMPAPICPGGEHHPYSEYFERVIALGDKSAIAGIAIDNDNQA